MDDKMIDTTDFDEISEKMHSLFPYQKDNVIRTINDFLGLNEKTSEYSFRVCPKCHEEIDTFGKGGYTYKDVDGKRERSKKLLELSGQTQQSGIIDLKGCPVLQTFARSFIQFVKDGLYVFLADISQILPFGKVFP